ncbi:MAG: geranylgeranylglycerol-phosphate geranylgeranyltransferase, partial [Halobacteriaceae archaeon]
NHQLLMSTAIIATILATGAGNAINDYFDREIDEINKPNRPIPRGAVSPTDALLFSLTLFGIAVLLALLLPPLAIAIAGLNLFALVAYTKLFKGLPGVGNAVVAYLGGSTFLFGGAAVKSLTISPIVLFVLAAFATFTREIIKDIEDIEGDRQQGLNTLPIAIGRRKAHWIATVSMAIALIVSPLPYLRETFGFIYLSIVIPADIIMGGATIMGFRNARVSQQWLKYGMFIAALAFILGRLQLSIP